MSSTIYRVELTEVDLAAIEAGAESVDLLFQHPALKELQQRSEMVGAVLRSILERAQPVGVEDAL